MKPFAKTLIWELCLQIAVSFFILGETCLFIGFISCLSVEVHIVPFACSLFAVGASIIGLIAIVTAEVFCDRKRIWQRISTNIVLIINVALVGKSVYLLIL